MTAEVFVADFVVHQRIALTTNRFELRSAGADATLLAVVDQEAGAYAHAATLFSDEARTTPLVSWTARDPENPVAGLDVTDAAGAALGVVRRDYSSSFLRNVWHLETPGLTGAGMERSHVVSLARRFTTLPFLPVHYDYVTPDDQPLMSIDRKRAVRDVYSVHVVDPRVDFRLAAVLAVALDAFANR